MTINTVKTSNHYAQLKKGSLLNTPWGVLSTIVVRLPLRVSQYTLKGVSVTLTNGVPINFKVVYITPLGVSITSLAVFSSLTILVE